MKYSTFLYKDLITDNMDASTSISIKKALEQSILDTNRVLRRWQSDNPRNFNDYDSIRSLLIGWLFRHLRSAVGYKHLKMYGRPIITCDYKLARVTSIVFPSTTYTSPSSWGSESKFINKICEELDYVALSKDIDVHEYRPTPIADKVTAFSSVNDILAKIRNTKFE